MSDFTAILTHTRRLKAAVKELSLDELRDVQAKLENVIADREMEEAELRRAEAEKSKKIAEIKQAMEAAGVDITDFVEQEGLPVTKRKTRTKRAPKPPKYAIVDANGERVTWTGQGRMPNALKDALAKGHNLATYLIK